MTNEPTHISDIETGIERAKAARSIASDKKERPLVDLTNHFLNSSGFDFEDYYELIRRTRGAVWSPEELTLWERKRRALSQYYESIHWWNAAIYVVPPVEDIIRGYADVYVRNQPRGVRNTMGAEKGYTLASWFARVLQSASGPTVTEPVRIAVEAFIVGRFRNLFIHSNEPGTGKTGLAIATAKALQVQEPNLVAEIVRMPELGLSIDRREAVLAGIREGIFILDDVHRFKTSSAFGSDYLWTLINKLMITDCRVIVTSNLHWGALLDKVGQDSAATFDRLHEGGLYEIQLEGFSLRR
jgi:hypothetical protein